MDTSAASAKGGLHSSDAAGGRAAAVNADGLLWAGLVLMIGPLLVRASSTLDVLPGWDVDPTSSPVLLTGLSPSGSMVCDAVSLLGSGMVMLFVRARRLPVSGAAIALAGIGAIAVLAHAFWLGPGSAHGSIGDQRIGCAWLSAIGAAVAAFHGSRDDRARRMILATLLGFVALLALRGAHEFFVDHPRTIADYRANKAQIRASHGWSDDSSMAKAFERRLFQSDVSGWFGLSNVYAAICGAGTVVLLGLLVIAVRGRREIGREARDGRLTILLLGVGLVLAIGGVAMAQSKGGVVALGVGVGSMVVLAWLRLLWVRRGMRFAPLLGGLLGVGAIVGALKMIVLRGLIGERIGELSIFFRWFYAQGAVRIFGAHPIWGVGPDGFQRAYTVAKNPISPEEVSSPHIVVLDWLSMLGVFGGAWCVLLMWWAWRGGRGAVCCTSAMTSPGSRNETRAAMAVAAVAALGSSYAQGSVVTVDLAIVRVVGLAAWCGVTWGVLRMLRRGAAGCIPVAGGAMVFLAHGQIDVELSWVQSCGIGLMLVGLAAGADEGGETGGEGTKAAGSGGSMIAWLAGVVSIAVAGVIVAGAVPRAWRWERALWSGVEEVRPIAELSGRLDEFSRVRRAGGTTTDSQEKIIGDLSQEVGRPVRPDIEDVKRAMTELDAARTPKAAEHLMEADAIDPSDLHARREASRLWVRYSDASRVLGRVDEVRRGLDEAVRVLEQRTADVPPPASVLASLAQVRLRRADVLNAPAEVGLAARALEQAMSLDPYNLDLARQRESVAVRERDAAGVRLWAAKCLELDGQMRLDREVRGLSEQERAEMRKAAGMP